MIKVNVFSEEKSWNERIKNKDFFFNNICKCFPKKYKFINKKINLSVLLSNNKNIKKLNNQFRKKNKSTDILSFPMDDYKKEKKTNYLGDIIISFNYINNPKNISKIQFKEKLTKIFIHGFLHLLGFDHLKDKDFKKMLIEEKKIFEQVKRKLS
tara:strand:- start:3848 stop:4309 length:462 start_codon:yes stop_codon:yes gene_type:complete